MQSTFLSIASGLEANKQNFIVERYGYGKELVVEKSQV